MSAPVQAAPTATVAERGREGVPPADAIVIVAVALAGAVAGFVVGRQIWAATLLVTLLLAIASRRGARQSRASEDHSPTELHDLPRDVRLVASGAFATLGDSDAARRLMEVVQPAAAWFATRESAFDARQNADARRQVADLVVDACTVALDLARLDATAPVVVPADAEIMARYQAARALFTKRLADAGEALGALYASGVERGTPASDRVLELAADIRQEASVRTAAKQELDLLLSGAHA